MDIKQKEILVRMIVEEVLNKISKSISKEVEKDRFIIEQDSYLHTSKTPVTAEKIESIVKKGYKKIIVPLNAIITPLARDIIKDNSIMITNFSEKNTIEAIDSFIQLKRNKIAILSNFDDEAYKVKTKQILHKHGIEVECLTTKNSTASELQIALNNLSQNIQLGKYSAGVVISNDAYQLRKSIKNDGNITTNICWEIGSDKICSFKSHLLFINSSLIGFKTLEDKLYSWLINKTG